MGDDLERNLIFLTEGIKKCGKDAFLPATLEI